MVFLDGLTGVVGDVDFQPSYCRAIRTRFVSARSSSTSNTRIGDPSAR